MSLAVRFDYFQGTGFCSSFSLFEDLIDSLCQFLMLVSDLASKEQFKAELEKVFNPALEQYLPLAFAVLAIGYFFRKL